MTTVTTAVPTLKFFPILTDAAYAAGIKTAEGLSNLMLTIYTLIANATLKALIDGDVNPANQAIMVAKAYGQKGIALNTLKRIMPFEFDGTKFTGKIDKDIKARALKVNEDGLCAFEASLKTVLESVVNDKEEAAAAKKTLAKLTAAYVASVRKLPKNHSDAVILKAVKNELTG